VNRCCLASCSDSDMDAYVDTDCSEGQLLCTATCSVDDKVDDSWREISTLLRLLRSCAVENAEYFSGVAVAGSALERLYTACSRMIDHVDGGVLGGVYALLQAAPLFDYSRQQPGNGYRSFVTVVHKCCLHLLTLVRYIRVNRDSYLFRAEHYSRELEAYVTVLGQLRACLYYLQKLVLFCMDGSLFPDENILSPEEYHTAEYLLKDFESLCQEAFYGRCLGFQVVQIQFECFAVCILFVIMIIAFQCQNFIYHRMNLNAFVYVTASFIQFIGVSAIFM